MVFDLVETVLLTELLFVECSLGVLFIGQDEDGDVFEVLIDDYLEELGFSDDFAFYVSAVNDEDDCVSTRVVGRPHAADALLSS